MTSIRKPLALAVAAIAIAGSLVGCTAAEPAPRTPTPRPDGGAFGAFGAEGCNPPSPTSGAEVQGTPATPGGSAFGEFQGTSPLTLRAGREEVQKLVVRVTGSGDLTVGLTDPAGTERRLAWGPEPHTASNYDRPGDEWGIGLPLDRRGCWEVVLARGTRPVATFWLSID